ncbi:prepilin-type N-terminal cleavage/methylation domain-containing protein [Natronospirillum operosum]|uniref:Prepilin-type N-terminal cleavage/methylation domain-containing protein n=1 Tax=Natronospirillum operosum TaxID=2759953 RepID=A0A4Z0W8L1_9GAMM|nr:prepilin-type N-terminal cleavage/methylation domain-containing protein [Natronospirillum operosum]TGG92338.1 prepilin-type N-terminal cleavage/methylation domain-containing protein [Natronospirillum operosum]
MTNQHPRGFTLIELIVVIVITGIIAAVVAPIVANQFVAYSDSSRRATLVQEAQSIMQRLEQDLYNAVPNSVVPDNAGNDLSLLLLARRAPGDPESALPAGRYSDSFNPSTANSEITVYGCLNSQMPLHAVIFPAQTGSALDAWDNWPNEDESPVSGPVADIDNTDCTTGTPATLTLAENHTFDPDGEGALFRRLYLTQGRVDWNCDETDGVLNRAQSFTPSGDRLVSNDIASCSFEPIIGSTYSAPGLLVDITLARDGEQVRLVRIFQLVNAP